MNLWASLDAVFDWVLQTSWQASCVVGLVLIAQWLFHRFLSPAWRFGLWFLVFARLLLPEMPSTSFSVLNVARLPGTGVRAAADSAEEAWETRRRVTGVSGGIPAITRSGGPPATSGSVPEGAPVNSREASVRPAREAMRQTALLVWCSIALLLTTRLVFQNIRFARRIGRRSAEVRQELIRLFTECQQLVGVRQPIQLVQTDEVSTPAIYGVWRPRLLLPAQMAGSFSENEFRHIFLHELAHVKRGDMLINWLMTLLGILHWFNPVLWLAFRRVRADRELAADALALASWRPNQNQAYGETIIKLLEQISNRAPTPGVVGILEDRNQMRYRMRLIATFKPAHRWSCAAAFLLLALGIASLTNAQSPKAAAELVAAIERAGGKVRYDESTLGRPVIGVDLSPIYHDYSGAKLSTSKLSHELLANVGKLTHLQSLELGGNPLPKKALRHLAGLSELRILWLGDANLVDSDLVYLRRLDKISNLGLSNNRKLTDAALPHLAHLHTLTNLNLANTAVTGRGFARLRLASLTHLELRAPFGDTGLASLKGMTNLKVLSLISTDITDDGLMHLQQLPNLQAAHMHYTSITDTGLAHLTKIPTLQRVTVTGCPGITDAAMAHIGQMHQLTWLRAVDTKIGDTGLLMLTNLTQLQRLDLNDTLVSDRGLAALGSMAKLENLTISKTKVTDAGMDKVAKLSRLKWLWLDGTAVSDAGVRKLSALSNLQNLRLWGTPLTEASVPVLKDMTSVKNLSFGLNGPGVTDATLDTLSGWNNLQELSLRGTAVTDSGLSRLKDLPSLSSLEIDSPGISDQGLAQLSSLQKLWWLGLGGNQFSDVGIRHLTSLTNLSVLELHSSGITDNAMEHVQRLTRLSSLNLSKTSVSDAGLRKLSALQALGSLVLDDTRVTARTVPLPPSLWNLSLAGTDLSDRTLSDWKSAARDNPLFELSLARTRVSDAGLARLKIAVSRLNISNSLVTGSGLLQFEHRGQLQSIYVHDGQLTSKDRQDLIAALPRLRIHTVPANPRN